jgi:phage tail protein X
MKAVFVAVVLGVCLCACGAVGIGAAPPSASPSTGPGLGFDVTVTEKTRVATLRVGEKLEAVLHANPGMTTWNDLQSSDPSVLGPIVNPAATAARGVTLGAFQALAPGKSHITANAGPLCSPGQVCPQYRVLLTIDVTVVA